MRKIELGTTDLMQLRKAKAAWERMQVIASGTDKNVAWLNPNTGKPEELDVELAQKEWASLCECVTLSMLCLVELM